MIFALLVAMSATGAPPMSPDLTQILTQAAIPMKQAQLDGSVEDFQPLFTIVSGATTLGAGECTHRSREVFQLKHRLSQFLVEKAGFTILELEASVPACTANVGSSFDPGNPSIFIMSGDFRRLFRGLILLLTQVHLGPSRSDGCERGNGAALQSEGSPESEARRG